MRDDGTAAEVEAPRRHIIKRPRLTRLLDQADARILMLVAPAGYGKTTLAREWIEAGQREMLWLEATPALNDLATFAIRLRDVLRRAFPAVEIRIEDRLRAGGPTLEPEVLAASMTEAVGEWFERVWLVIDDYQHLESPQVQTLLHSFLVGAHANALIATRRRPDWATARRLVYGELLELGQNALAMTYEEAAEVLGGANRTKAMGLIALADGWPAILGLVADGASGDFPRDALPASLYDFFAEELYQSASRQTQETLTRLAVAPKIDAGVAEVLLSDEASVALAEATRLGLLHYDEGAASYRMHSLFKDFLRRRHVARAEDVVSAAVSSLSDHYLANGQFDELFAVVTESGSLELSNNVTNRALMQLLTDDRIEAVGPWLEHSRATRLETPAADLAAAEFAFRDGRYGEAEVFASQSAAKFETTSPLTARAWFRAGLSAYHENRSSQAVEHHHRALETATRESERLQAVWGLLIATLELEGDTTPWMAELEVAAETDPASRLRLANARLATAHRFGGIDEATADAEAVLALVERVPDPMVTSAFLNSFASCLVLSAQYRRALDIVEQEIAVIKEFQLNFAMPHALASRIAANMGLRRFRESTRDLLVARQTAERARDDFSLGNLAANRIRLMLAQGRPDEAANVAAETLLPALKSLQGEVIAAQALALAASGKTEDARQHLATARSLTRSNETLAFASWAHVVAASVEGDENVANLAADTYAKLRPRGCMHPLVCAYRAHPRLLVLLKTNDDVAREIRNLVDRANDQTLAKSAGFDVTLNSTGDLSPRETEVLRLLGEGLANREIANRLFISEVTAKVHVRNIFDKLGVRTRTAAALLASSYLADGD